MLQVSAGYYAAHDFVAVDVTYRGFPTRRYILTIDHSRDIPFWSETFNIFVVMKL